MIDKPKGPESMTDVVEGAIDAINQLEESFNVVTRNHTDRLMQLERRPGRRMDSEDFGMLVASMTFIIALMVVLCSCAAASVANTREKQHAYTQCVQFHLPHECKEERP